MIRMDVMGALAARMPRWRQLLAGASAVLSCWLVAACGGGGGERSQPLPLGEGHPSAYTEQYLALHPQALVQPGHIVVLRQEAAVDGEDDTGGEQGVDEIAYHVPNAMTVTLKVDAASPTISHLVLRDDRGREMGRHHREDPDAKIVTLQPGRHVLELHHLAKGDKSVAPRAIFLRLAEAGTSVEASLTRAQAAAAGGAATALVQVATASANCLHCVFSASDMSGSSVYNGADLSGSQFTNTRLVGASLVGSRCVACSFTNSDLSEANFTSSTLDGSTFDGSNLRSISIVPGDTGPASCAACLFSGPNLENMHLWGANLRGSTIAFSNPYIYVIDLSYADCTGCDIGSQYPASLTVANFQGATLEGAGIHTMYVETGNFQGVMLNSASITAIHCETCHFPSAQLLGTKFAQFICATLCDFSGAAARGAHFTDNTVIHAGYWSGADLSGASIDGPTWTVSLAVSGSFAGAKLNDLQPADYLSTLMGTFCCLQHKPLDFRGAQLHGLDLSATDFSTAKAIVDANTDFAGAVLSNGSSGIRLSGQNLVGSSTLAGHDLRYAQLSNTTLTNTDLSRTDLSSAVLIGAKLAGSSLAASKLVGAQLGVGSVSDGVAADLTDAYIAGTDFSDADLRSVDLSKARAFGGASFRRARMDAALLAGAMLAEADFGSASLTGTTFTGAWLVNANFDGALMARTRLGSSWLLGTALAGAGSIDGLTLDDASVSVGSGSWTYTEQDGSLKTYRYDAATLGAMATSATTVTCPNRQRGPCDTAASLTPSSGSPFPPVPACTTDWRGNTTCR